MKLTKEKQTEIVADCLEKQITSENPDKRHGGPWDRGGADSYYHRAIRPHYFEGGTGPMTEAIMDLNEDEVRAYMAGYIENEKSGDHKVWA